MDLWDDGYVERDLLGRDRTPHGRQYRGGPPLPDLARDVPREEPLYLAGPQRRPSGSRWSTGFEGDAILTGNTVTAAMHVNVLRYNTLFIASSLGSHNDSVGPISQSTIARKVVLSEARGGMVEDHHSLPHDFIALEPQSISAITFRLTDWKGGTVPMSIPWSLSIILVEEQEF